MARVVLENVGKTYPNGFVAVRDLSLEAADGEFLVLVGPSGCGKSTTLRLIAGLEEATGGTIRIGDRVVNNVHPKDRDIAMVFQNYALYPHMTVYRNMAFALKLRRVPRDEIDRRVRGTARMLGIEELLDKRPRVLSGGQRQRVAVGRAIVREPKAFLFDEPLSNLDARLRVTTRAELKALHQRLKTTTVYVTHDQEEAMTLGDRIAVMSDGVLRQAAAPLEVYRRPVNRFVASFIGMPPMNFLDGRLERSADGVYFTEQPSAGAAPSAGNSDSLRLAPPHADRLADHLDRPVVLGVRPQSLSLTGGGTGAGDAAPMMTLAITVVEPLGDSMDVHAATAAGRSVVARVLAQAGVQAGSRARFTVDMAQVHLFEPGELGRNLTL